MHKHTVSLPEMRNSLLKYSSLQAVCNIFLYINRDRWSVMTLVETTALRSKVLSRSVDQQSCRCVIVKTANCDFKMCKI